MTTYRIDIREGDGSGSGRPGGTPRPAPIRSVTFNAPNHDAAMTALDNDMEGIFDDVYGELFEADTNTFLTWQRAYNPIDRRWAR